MLDGFFLGPAIDAVTETLRSATGGRPLGPIAVIGKARLARGLAERGLEVVVVEAEPRSLKKLRFGTGLRARGEALPIADRALAAVVGWGAGTRTDWADLLGEWSRTVADGGVVVMVDKAPSTELSRRALCGGLAELQQRPAGRLVVTSGIVTDL